MSCVESMGLTTGLTLSMYRDGLETAILEKKRQATANDLVVSSNLTVEERKRTLHGGNTCAFTSL